MVLKTYNLQRETPKGYWIAYGGSPGCFIGDERWVSKTSRKRFAYPTKEEAMVNLIARTKSRIKILKSQLSTCEIALASAEKLKI